MGRRFVFTSVAVQCLFALIALWRQPARSGERLGEITIDAVCDPDGQTLQVSQIFSLQNRTAEERPDLILRTCAAAFRAEDYAPRLPKSCADDAIPAAFRQAVLKIRLPIWPAAMRTWPRSSG